MTKEEFFDTLDKLLRLTSQQALQSLPYEIIGLLRIIPSNTEHDTYLAEYLTSPNHKQPKYNQLAVFWALANSFNNTPLMDALIELHGGKVTYDLLIEILDNCYCTIFEYAIYLYHNNDKNPDHLFRIIKLTIDNYHPAEFNAQAIDNLFNTINLKSFPKEDLGNLLYYAITYNPRMAEALIRYGCNPFGNYWDRTIDVNTGIPILFEAVQNNDGFDFIQQHNDTQEWWNTTDQWGRNLLHFAVKHRNFYDLLVGKGVNPDHRALIDDNKLTLAKIKRQPIPPEYGKTPRELP